MAITEESATAFVKSYCNDFNGSGKSKEQCEAYVAKYHKEDMMMIRPSGNPLTNDMYLGMLTSGDMSDFKEEFVEVASTRILAGGEAACVFYTSNQYFSYQGIPNEDHAKMSVVLEEVDGAIKIAYGHRCAGQPVPEA